MVGYLRDAGAAAHRTGHRLVEAPGAALPSGCHGGAHAGGTGEDLGQRGAGCGAWCGSSWRCRAGKPATDARGLGGGTGLRIRGGAGRMLKPVELYQRLRTMKTNMNIALSALAAVVDPLRGTARANRSPRPSLAHPRPAQPQWRWTLGPGTYLRATPTHDPLRPGLALLAYRYQGPVTRCEDGGRYRSGACGTRWPFVFLGEYPHDRTQGWLRRSSFRAPVRC
jgi:hypothetical protein